MNNYIKKIDSMSSGIYIYHEYDNSNHNYIFHNNMDYYRRRFINSAQFGISLNINIK